MPQLSQLALVYQSQWFWLLLVLGVIYFFVGRGIVPKVEATVDQRDAQIAADLAEAERLREEADATEEAWRATINQAHAEAQAVAARGQGRGRSAMPKSASPRPTRSSSKKLDEAAAALDEARKAALREIEDDGGRRRTRNRRQADRRQGGRQGRPRRCCRRH